MKKIKKINVLLASLLVANIYPICFGMSSEKETENVKNKEDVSSSVSVKQESVISSDNLLLKNQKLKGENLELTKRNLELTHKNLELANKNLELEDENTKLKRDYNGYRRKARRYKKKYDEKKDYISPEQSQNEVEKVRTQMTLEFAKYMSEYIKSNPKKRMRNFDMRGLFSNFVNFNVNYNNRGDTTFAPLAVKGEAKAAAGAAALAI